MHRNAWKGNSRNYFAITEFSEDEMRRPTPYAVPFGSANVRRALKCPIWKEDRPTSDGSKDKPKMTAGLDIGDKYSYLLCLIDQESGEIMEEGLLCPQPQRPSGDASPPSSLLCA
jgi:hypothetical protein